MSPADISDTEKLLNRAAEGDAAAVNELFGRHRQRLRHMVAVRMDHRIARRVDPSDVVQETLAEACEKLPEYLTGRPVAFYPWLRQLAWNRLRDLYRFHVEGAKRSVEREVEPVMGLSDKSVMGIAKRLAASGTSPSRHMLRREVRERVRQALDQLPSHYREVLVMRHLEQLSIPEIAVIAGISQGTVKSRLFRGLPLLQEQLGDERSGVSQ